MRADEVMPGKKARRVEIRGQVVVRDPDGGTEGSCLLFFSLKPGSEEIDRNFKVLLQPGKELEPAEN